jgi:hypothetical protein
MFAPALLRSQAFIACVCLILAAPVPLRAAQGDANSSTQGPQASPTPSVSPSPGASANPFPSPSPTPTPGPIGNGYAIVGFSLGNASGGVIPSPASSTTPPPAFPSSNATGFFVDLVGRFSPVYTAALHFGDSSIHGADHPVVTLSDGHLYYTPSGGTFGFGIGYASLQRSSSMTSANQFGLGAVLLPDLRRGLSPYVNLSYYPSARTQGAAAGIATYEVGLTLTTRRPGVIFKLGYGGLSYPNVNTSPSSIGNATFGVGLSF